jgi:hypothetical protein
VQTNAVSHRAVIFSESVKNELLNIEGIFSTQFASVLTGFDRTLSAYSSGVDFHFTHHISIKNRSLSGGFLIKPEGRAATGEHSENSV